MPQFVILIIEDEPEHLNLIKIGVGVTCGSVEVLSATNLKDAFKVFTEHKSRIDFVAVDFNMPEDDADRSPMGNTQLLVRHMIASGYPGDQMIATSCTDSFNDILLHEGVAQSGGKDQVAKKMAQSLFFSKLPS